MPRKPNSANTSFWGFAFLAMLPSCANSPSSEILRPLQSDYRIEKISIEYLPGTTVFVAGEFVPANATPAAQAEIAKTAIEKGIRHRLSEVMKGAKPANLSFVVKQLNCPAVPEIAIIGGFSYLSGDVAITDAANGSEIYPKRVQVATDAQGFGTQNFASAKQLEPGGERNCPLLLSLQLAAGMFGLKSVAPLPIVVSVPVAR
jgi:hypothetical protein